MSDSAVSRLEERPVEKDVSTRVQFARMRDRVVVTVPGARNTVWVVAAVLYGVPWLLTLVIGSAWYLGWGTPSNVAIRIGLWIMLILLTFAMHIAALLSVWGALYARMGTEEVTFDGERITVTRRAGFVPLRVHIARSAAEQAQVLPPHRGRVARPRIEVRSGRSALRFGAGLTGEEAEACVEAISALLDHSEEPVFLR